MHDSWKSAAVIMLAPVMLAAGPRVAAANSYRVSAGDTLYLIAQRYGTTAEDLARENGLSSTMIYPGQILSIGGKSREAGTSQSYKVRAGDSLYLIAVRHGTTVAALKAANGLSGDYIEAGQQLTIPGGTGKTGGETLVHVVQSGDTLYLLAQRYGTTVTALKSANGLTGDQLYPGQQLRLPSGAGSAGSGSDGNQCTVRAGDTLYLIAMRYGTSVAVLKAANGITGDTIYPGQSLTIPSSGGSSTHSTTSISNSDAELLARLVSAEAAGEPYAGQVAVAATVLNRLNDAKYPKTISGIIYQSTNGIYQYSPVIDGRIDEPAASSAVAAVQDALKGWDPSNGATGFYNPAKTSNQWVTSQPVTATIGDHVFFKY